MLPCEVCAMQCYCLCSHVLPVHYSGILKKNKRSCSLILFNLVFFFFFFEVNYCTCSFFFLPPPFFFFFFFGRWRGWNFWVPLFIFPVFERDGIAGKDPASQAPWPRGHKHCCCCFGLVCNKLLLFSQLQSGWFVPDS